MDSGSTRVEIELEPADVKRSRRRSVSDVAPVTVLDSPPVAPPPVTFDEPAPTPGTPRNQLVVIALAVGLVALFLGWVLGRAGGDGEAQTSGSAASTAATATSSAPATSAVTDETLPKAQLPTTTRPARTTTTTLAPAWTDGQITLDPRLAGLTDRLVVLADGRKVIDVSLADGSMRAIDLPPARGTPAGIVVGDGWILLADDSGNPPNVLRDDGSIEQPSFFSDVWSTFWDVGTDRFWVMQYDSTSGRVESAEAVTIDGERTGEEISTRGRWISGSDPAGGVIVSDGFTGMYRIAPDGTSSRLAEGVPLAISANHVLVHRCGDDLDTCETVLIDRVTGEERVVPIPDEEREGVSPVAAWWSGPMGTSSTLNADGSAAIVATGGNFGSPHVAVLDTGSGSLTELTSPLTDATLFQPYLGASWSSDGRFVFVALAGTLHAHDRTTGELFPVTESDVLDGAQLVTFAAS